MNVTKKQKIVSMPIIVWLAALPTGVAERAVLYAHHHRYEDVYERYAPTLTTALCEAFNFTKTAEGADFWFNVAIWNLR